MTNGNGTGGRWGDMGLQTKLLSGFLMLVVAIGIAGGSGVYFSSRIGASVGTLTGVALPLLEEAVGLVEETRQVHIEMLEEMGHTYTEDEHEGEDEGETEPADHAHESVTSHAQESLKGGHVRAGARLNEEEEHAHWKVDENLAALAKSGKQALKRLSRLSAEGGLAFDVKTVQELAGEFSRLGREMLAAHQLDELKSALARQRQVEFEQERRHMGARLDGLIQHAEAGMNEREDGLRRLANSGRATVAELQLGVQQVFDESYPILHGGYKLQDYLMKMENKVRGALAERRVDALAGSEQSFSKLAKKFMLRLRKVTGRVEDQQIKQAIAELLKEFLVLEAIVGDKNGLFAAHRASLEAAAQSDAIQVSLNQTGERFEAVLGGIAGQARELYQHVKQETATQVNFAQVAISAIVLAGTMISLLFGFMFARRISAPVKQLTAASREMAGGTLSVRVPVLDNSDLGQMGQSFNQMAIDLGDIVKSVQGSGIQVASSTTEMAATMKEQEASATEQAATARQIVATSKQISTTAKDLLRSMDQVAQVATETASLAEEGSSGLTQMQASMGQMAEASRSITEKLTVLNDKASTISSVVTTINKVADQTNLLSLNAAIEAEKAGEYGIGFGVVATEIRRLADQTAVATWDIEQVVQEMQSAVSAGVMGMEKFSDEVRMGVVDSGRLGGQLSRIVQQVQALAPHFESVHGGMQSQTQGAEQIDEAIVQLSETVSQTADSLRESSRVIEHLNQASEQLQEAVSGFTLGEGS